MVLHLNADLTPLNSDDKILYPRSIHNSICLIFLLNIYIYEIMS